MELFYPDEYFLEVIEDVSRGCKEGYYDIEENIELNTIMNELDKEYIESFIGK